jgi:beta-galactosidase/beta-glucuronidase
VSGPGSYPRPLLRRERWASLNGDWDFAIDADARWRLPGDVRFDRRIAVPFAPESPASGIGDTGFYHAVWYRRRWKPGPCPPGDRVFLHFGAVDYEAMVWIDGKCVACHEGGYTPFRADVTEHVGDGTHEIVVRAYDDPHDLAKPRGKQDWLLEPHSIWYPRTTGIWQTVWSEHVPPTRVGRIQWMPNLERWEVACDVQLEGDTRTDLRLRVVLSLGNILLADDTYSVMSNEVSRRIALSDPGIDDYRNELLWSPSSPTLIDARLELLDPDGRVIDTVVSYTALRTIRTQGDRIVLNGRPFEMRAVLDQGYWPESGLTPPSDEALRRDVELARAMGFNTVRKHQKLEDPRYLYWADRLGLLVWTEMPSAYRFTQHAIDRLTREWLDAITRDISHPCVMAWVPFNESWGVPNLPDVPAERHFVEAMYHLTKTRDPTRPIVGNDGWESVATDIIGIHDYDDEPEKIAARYRTEEEIPRLFRRERPGGRLLTLEGHPHQGQPIVLSEFGGIALATDASSTWGYSRAANPEEFATRYAALLAVVRSLSLLGGFCYTQFADTYQEANGLLRADRTPKVPLERIAEATRGPRTARDEEVELEWRLRMMKFRRDHEVPSV